MGMLDLVGNRRRFIIIYFIKFPAHFRTVIERSNQEPTKKYLFPQTESQEYGWISQPLVRSLHKFRTVLLVYFHIKTLLTIPLW